MNDFQNNGTVGNTYNSGPYKKQTNYRGLVSDTVNRFNRLTLSETNSRQEANELLNRKTVKTQVA